MAKYGSPSLVIEFDNSGGTLVDITQHVLEINGVKISAILEESHSFGDAWFESLAVGLRKMAPVTIQGFYDDAASTGPDALFGLANFPSGPAATTRTLRITWGSTKTTTVEMLIGDYERQATRGQIHRYAATLQPTGAVTEA